MLSLQLGQQKRAHAEIAKKYKIDGLIFLKEKQQWHRFKFRMYQSIGAGDGQAKKIL